MSTLLLVNWCWVLGMVCMALSSTLGELWCWGWGFWVLTCCSCNVSDTISDVSDTTGPPIDYKISDLVLLITCHCLFWKRERIWATDCECYNVEHPEWAWNAYITDASVHDEINKVSSKTTNCTTSIFNVLQGEPKNQGGDSQDRGKN